MVMKFLKYSPVHSWYNWCKKGQKSLQDKVCSGTPAISNNDKHVAKVCTTIISDQCSITEKMANARRISCGINTEHTPCRLCVCVCVCVCALVHFALCVVHLHVLCVSECVCVCVWNPETKCHVSRWHTNILQKKKAVCNKISAGHAWHCL